MSSQRVIIDTLINGFDCRFELDVNYYVDKNTIHHPNGYSSYTEKFITLTNVDCITIDSEQIPSIIEVNKWIELNESLIIEQIEL